MSRGDPKALTTTTWALCPRRCENKFLALLISCVERRSIPALDYREAVSRATPDDLIYMDPPYQGVCGERDPRYLKGVLVDEFVEALELLNHRDIKYLVSCDGRTGDRVHRRRLARAAETALDRTRGRAIIPSDAPWARGSNGGIPLSLPRRWLGRSLVSGGIIHALWPSNWLSWRGGGEQPKLPPGFVDLCKAVTANRPWVIDHILKHGFITTQDLDDTYGYNHPPRAVRDVKEHGIPIEMFRVKGGNGRKIAAYRLVTRARLGPGSRLGGRCSARN